MAEIALIVWKALSGAFSWIWGIVKSWPWYGWIIAIAVGAAVFNSVGWKAAADELAKQKALVATMKADAELDQDSIRMLQEQVKDQNADIEAFKKASDDAQKRAAALAAQQLPGQQARAAAAAALRAAPPPVSDVTAPDAYQKVRNQL